MKFSFLEGHTSLVFSSAPLHYLPVDVFADLLSTPGVISTGEFGEPEFLHSVVDVAGWVADVDSSLLLIPGKHPHL